jgi:hypothetical protein
LTLNVAAGADGSYSLYEDAGEGAPTASTTTPFTWRDASRTLTIGAAAGTYPGAPASRSYTLRLTNAGAPTAVSVDGVQVPETAWSYNSDRRTVTVTTAALPVAAAHTVTLTGTAAGNPSGGEVIGVGGLCVDVRGGTAADGQPVQVYTCNHTAAQQVTYAADGTLRLLGRCLTADTGPVTTGACAQTWTHRSDGALVNTASGRCLDVPDGNTTPGAVQLQVYTCNGSAAQTWRPPPGPIAGASGMCADVADADPASGTPVQLWSCNSSDAQRWSAPGDQTVRALGKCLDARGAGTANGTAAQLFDCNGTAAQQWTTRSDGTILNPVSGRCLDDAGGLLHAGDRLQLYDCNSTPAQQFRLA